MGDPARWISVGELAQAFGPDNFTPAQSGDLAGSRHVLHFEDGRTVDHVFHSESRLAWKLTGGEPALGEPGGAPGGEASGVSGEAAYSALKVRDGIYFVDYVAHQAPPTAVSLVLDLGLGIATSLVAGLPDAPDVGESLIARVAAGRELTAVTATFSSAAVDAPFTAETPRHEPTPELIGRRVEYTYSTTERYEHIYLNEDFYTWHCLQGSEKGLADTDRCHYLKLGDQLYLFVWREKIIPTLGAVVADFAAMRTMGKIFGHAQDGSGGVSDFSVGARVRLLNVTAHEQGIRS